MTILGSKWMLIPILLLLLLAVLYGIGKKSVHHEITIPASPEEIWAVLTATQQYPEWNPVMIKAFGELTEGKVLTYTFRQDDAKEYEISAHVKKIETARLLNQTGGTFGILTFDHQYILKPFNSSTRVTIHEDYRGVFVPFWNPAPVQQAYQRLNEALFDRVNTVKRHE